VLDVVLPLNRCSNIVKPLEINQTFQSMLLRETFDKPGSMRKHTTNKVARYADIQNAVGSIGHDVNIATSFHGPILKDVDGRDKPGHDGHNLAGLFP
jgi:hypothetical protein